MVFIYSYITFPHIYHLFRIEEQIASNRYMKITILIQQKLLEASTICS